MNKKCRSCGQSLPPTMFYVNKSKADGLGTECRDCHKAWRKLHYRTHKEQTDATVKRWRTNHPEVYRAVMRAGSRRHNEKVKSLGLWDVYGKVQSAVRCGLLTPQPCVVCGSPDVVAHHEDYSKPLDVIWYCIKHHNELHRNTGSRLHTIPGRTPPEPVKDGKPSNAGESSQ